MAEVDKSNKFQGPVHPFFRESWTDTLMTLARMFLCKFTRNFAVTILGCTAVLGWNAAARAQAPASAVRSADAFVYGAYEFTKPDYGQTYQNNEGFLGGATYLRYVRVHSHPLSAGLDVRYDYNTGQVNTERAFTGSLRIGGTYRSRYHIYGTVGLGQGDISFKYLPSPGYTHDNGYILCGGGGIDVDVKGNFGVMFGVQGQAWHLGVNDQIDPANVNIGIVYHIPFHPWVSHGHED
jgi:hypothetical protein